MSKNQENANAGRWRCLESGCNPVLDATTATSHREASGHRVAKWPVRSAEGQRRAKLRNQTGYYNKYNVGEKSYSTRAEHINGPNHNDYIHPFEEEAFS